MDHLLSRNSRIEEDVIDQLFNSSEKRLARLLLLLANYGKEGNATATTHGRPACHEYSQHHVAALARPVQT
jgi:hypothetical protein